MVTLIQVLHSSGHRERCDAHCHNARTQPCACCCGGRYHGKHEGGVSLWNEVREHQDAILLDLGLREQRGELFIELARGELGSQPMRRRRDSTGAYQTTLLP